MQTKITVPLSATNKADMRSQAKEAVALGAEMLELRIDYLNDLSVDLAKDTINSIQQLTPLPLIVTCRDEQEGGAHVYSAELRLKVLIQAVSESADFIDLEFVNFRNPVFSKPLLFALSQSDGCRLILSAHDFKKPFADLKGLYQEIRNVCPQAIPKLVYTANHINDCFEAIDLLHNEKKADIIVLCMGPAGLICRILARKLGALVSFASLDSGKTTAPGQLTIAQLKEIYRFSDSNPATKLFGIIADPVEHSMSPAIHNACFARNKMDRLYLPLLVSDGANGLNAFLDNVTSRNWLGFRGFSITIPHKENALDYVRQHNGIIEPLVEKIGATNTLVIDEQGKLSAFNTDYVGAMASIAQVLDMEQADLNGKQVAIIGAGGVACAIVAGLVDVGAEVIIYNRTVSKAQSLAKAFNCGYSPLEGLTEMKADLLINCTSIGMSPNINESPVAAEIMRAEMAVFDTVYNPLQTLLIKNAAQVEAKTIDGLSMFVGQAMAQFKHFTNEDGDPELMRKVVEKQLRTL